MLKAKIWAESRHGAEVELGFVEITNITQCDGRMSSDYLWRVHGLSPGKHNIDDCGYLVDSNNSSALQLLHDVLSEWQSRRKYPIDNHGHMGLPEGIEIEAHDLWDKLDSYNNPYKDIF